MADSARPRSPDQDYDYDRKRDRDREREPVRDDRYEDRREVRDNRYDDRPERASYERSSRYDDRHDDRDRDSRRDYRSDDRYARGPPPPPPPPRRPVPAPEASNVLGVFGLSIMTKERDLEHEFGRYGQVDKVVIVYDQRSDRSRGFGFVTMASIPDAEECIKNLNAFELHGRRMRVDFSTTRAPHQPTPGQYMGHHTPSSVPAGPRYSSSYGGPPGRDRDRYARRESPPRRRFEDEHGYDRERSPPRRRRRSPSYGERRSRSRSPPRHRSRRDDSPSVNGINGSRSDLPPPPPPPPPPPADYRQD